MPWRDPVLEDVAARLPQRDAVGVVGRPELDRVDVLVLLRRVLGVADRAVGPLLRTTRDGRAPRGGRGCTGARSPAPPRGRGPRRRRRRRRSRRWCRGRGATASWPPSGPPMAHGLPGSSGPATRLLSRPLRWVVPIGWIGRQVHDVEAEVGDVARGARWRPSARRSSAGTARTRRRGRRAGRSTQSGCGGRRRQPGVGHARRPARATSSAQAAASRTSSVQLVAADARRRRPAGASWPWRPDDLGGEVLEEARALLQLELDVLPGRRLHLDLVAPGGVAVGPRVDHQLVQPDRPPVRSSPPTGRRRPGRSGADSQPRSPFRRHRTRAPSRSCPSATSWADTGTRSPPTALAGNPPGVRGWTSSITIGVSTSVKRTSLRHPRRLPAPTQREPVGETCQERRTSPTGRGWAGTGG